MSLARKALSAMEIDADKIDRIIEMHSETVNALNEKIDEYKELAEKYKAEADKVAGLQTELETAKKEAETAKNSGAEYDKLKKEFDDYKADVERKAVRASKEAAYKEILKDAGVAEKHYDTLLKYLDVDGVELDEKGKIVTAKDLLKEIKTDFEPYIQKTQTQGAQVVTPPANQGGRMTREQIDAIEDTAERQRAMLQNHDLYGI